MKGSVDPKTGMVANISVLKAVFAYILESVDHRNLDVDVPFFKSHVSTTENFCIYFSEVLIIFEDQYSYNYSYIFCFQ